MRCAAGLKKLYDVNNLTGLSFHYEGFGLYGRIASGLTAGAGLMASAGRPFAIESDMRSCVTMLAAYVLGGGGAQAGFAGVDFSSNAVSVGLAEPVCEGAGAEQPASIPGEGEATLLGLATDEAGRFAFICAEGVILAGNGQKKEAVTASVRFGGDPARFIEDWSFLGGGRRFVISQGLFSSAAEKFSKALGVGYKRIG